MRSALLAAVAALVAFASAPGMAAAAPCPSGTAPAFLVGARSEIAFDRQARIEVYALPESQPGVVASDLRLEFVDAEGHVFFGHAFASDDVPGVAPETWALFPVRLASGDAPVLVRLSYTLRVGEQALGCSMVHERVVSGVPGLEPRVEMVGQVDLGRAVIAVGTRDGCDRTAPEAVKVVVSQRGRQAVRRLRDFCDRASRWRGHGSLPVLQFRGAFPEQVPQSMPDMRHLFLQDTSHLSRVLVYRVEVFWGDQLVLRRWMLARTVRFSDRIYAVPFCRRAGKKIHSDLRGARYCLEPDWNHRLTVHRTAPAHRRP
jgi:hypothetical protein